LLGLGDAPDTVPELDWAAREAHSRGQLLRVVRAADPITMAVPWNPAGDRSTATELQHAAETRLQWADHYLHETWPDLRVESVFVEGATPHVLLDCAERAELIVLGSRRLGSIGAALLGSVGTTVAARADVPVVIVRAAPDGHDHTVVVGVDGSPATHEVMSFALDHASRYQLPLRAVFCYSYDLLATSPWRATAPSQALAQRWLAEMCDGWQEKYPDVDIHREAVREHPIHTLVGLSRGQDLLVVGHHSDRSRIRSMLGSVSQGVLHHASCPVAVVPLADQPE
jgi:nucleotide-binding universal stress UspA family protein